MNKAGDTDWQPEADAEYGQRLIPYLLLRYRWLLVAGIILGGLVFGITSLFSPASYSTRGTLHITKGSASAGMLSGMSLLGGADAGLADEMQILKSREIGWEVINELGLQVKIYDPHNADAPLMRIKNRLIPPSGAVSREEIYTRLSISDVDVNPNMLGDKQAWISIDANGGWEFDGKSGSAGDAVSTSTYSFTPLAGSAANAGECFELTILPDFRAWAEYASNLSVSSVTQRGNIIAIRFAHPNPLIAKQVVETVIEKYLEYTHTMTYGDFDLMLDYITEETTTTTARLDALMAELAEYRDEHKIYAEAAQGATAVQSLATLSLNRADQQIQLKQIDNVLAMIQSRTPEEINATIQAPATSLPIEQELTGQLASLIQSLETARLTKTAAHPQVISLEEKITTVLGQIEESLSTSRSNVHTSIRGLDSSVSEVRTQLQALPEASGKIALLTGEIGACQQVLAMLAEQGAQTKLRRAGTSAEVRVLDEPPMPAKRDKPLISRDGAMGVAIGALVAVLLLLALEGMRHGFRTLRELRVGLGLNILAVLPGRTARKQWRVSEPDPELARQIAQLLGSGDGKPITLVHLGKSPSYDLCWMLSSQSSDTEQPTLLIDGDMLGSQLCCALKQSAGAGLAEVCRDPHTLTERATLVDKQRSLLRPGQGEITADGLENIATNTQGHYSHTLLCLPAPGRWFNPEQWAAGLGNVVLTVPQDGASRSEIADALAQLRGMGVGIRGIVVTNFSATRDPLSSEELALVTVVPAVRT